MTDSPRASAASGRAGRGPRWPRSRWASSRSGRPPARPRAPPHRRSAAPTPASPARGTWTCLRWSTATARLKFSGPNSSHKRFAPSIQHPSSQNAARETPNASRVTMLRAVWARRIWPPSGRSVSALSAEHTWGSVAPSRRAAARPPGIVLDPRRDSLRGVFTLRCLTVPESTT